MSKRTVICLMLCMIMLCGSLNGCVPAVPAQQPQASAAPVVETEPTAVPSEPENEKKLPEAGDEIHGFVVKKIIPMEVLGADGVLFEHEKSGATLLYLASKDTNRSFQIAFRTPALDDKGKPHVFEHMTICGSQKYPDANLFFPFINRTYSTFVNAFTYSGMTVFPVASLSEDQLMRMMDYYLSGTFTPLLYSEPKLVDREAWRYELADADSPINIAGTVYSEMQGAMTFDAQANLNMIKTLYKDSPVAHESGGLPEDIRTLTYDELIEFHDTYYHPSNALITLYGDIDYENFLKFIDEEYLSKYDKKDIYVERGEITPFNETEYATFESPVEKGVNTKDASSVYYAFALNGISEEEYLSIGALTGVLSQESSPVMRALRNKLPNASIGISISFDCPSAPYLAFSASGINEKDRDVFVSTIDEALKQMSEEGVSEDSLDSVLALNKLQLMTTPEDKDLGVDACQTIALGWVYFGNVEFYTLNEKAINELTVQRANELLGKYLLNNTHRAVSLTKPVAGLAEKNAAVLNEELEKKKSSMSAEEISKMVEETKSFAAWSAAPVSEEIIGSIVDVDISALSEEVQHYDIKDETDGGIRYLSAEAQVGDVFKGTILLDGSTIPVDKLQDVQAYLQLLGSLDTDKHSKEELSMLLTRYLSGMDVSIVSQKAYGGEPDLYSVMFTWLGLGEDAQKAVELVREIAFETDFSDIDTIKGTFVRDNTYFRKKLDNDPLSLQIARCSAMLYDADAYLEYVSDYAYYDHLEELIKMADTDPAQLKARMENAREIVNNKNNAIVLCAGNSEAISAYRKQLPVLFADMTDEKREKADYSQLRLKKQNEAVVNNSTVQMNLLVDAAKEYSGKTIVLNNMISDRYMTPQLRNALGAYGAYADGSEFMKALYTYRDPNLKGSFDIFAKLPEYLRTAEFTQEDVDAYIIGSYSSLARPAGALSGAYTAMLQKLLGLSEEQKLQWQKEAKSTTVEDVRAAAESYEALVQNGIKSSSGTAQNLEQAKELFDSFVKLEEADASSETPQLKAA